MLRSFSIWKCPTHARLPQPFALTLEKNKELMEQLLLALFGHGLAWSILNLICVQCWKCRDVWSIIWIGLVLFHLVSWGLALGATAPRSGAAKPPRLEELAWCPICISSCSGSSAHVWRPLPGFTIGSVADTSFPPGAPWDLWAQVTCIFDCSALVQIRRYTMIHHQTLHYALYITLLYFTRFTEIIWTYVECFFSSDRWSSTRDATRGKGLRGDQKLSMRQHAAINNPRKRQISKKNIQSKNKDISKS